MTYIFIFLDQDQFPVLYYMKSGDRFVIKIKEDRIVTQLQVTCLQYDPRGKERYRVTGKDLEIELESNRPFLRARGLKHKRPIWKLVAGRVQYSFTQDQITTAIENALEN